MGFELNMDFGLFNIIIIMEATGIIVSSLLLHLFIMRLKLPGLVMT